MEKPPVTQAVRTLRANKVDFTDHLYKFEEHGGTTVSAHELGVPEHCVVKTLVTEHADANPLLVLMPGDMKVSTKELARTIGTKAVRPCTPEAANRHTGYMVGGTSAFGTRTKMPVYMERSILDLPRIYINGGRRGYLVGTGPKEAMRIDADIGVDGGGSGDKRDVTIATA